MIERSRRSTAGSPGSFASRVDRDRVHVRRGDAGDRAAAGKLRALDRAREDLAGPIGAVVLDDRVDGLEPLGGLDGVDVGAGAV